MNDTEKNRQEVTRMWGCYFGTVLAFEEVAKNIYANPKPSDVISMTADQYKGLEHTLYTVSRDDMCVDVVAKYVIVGNKVFDVSDRQEI